MMHYKIKALQNLISNLFCLAFQIALKRKVPVTTDFYFVMQHQTYLIVGEWQPEKVYYQSEVKLVCGHKDFPF